MPLDLPTLRKLVALDANDPLSRFALGRKLAEVAADAGAPELVEAADHLIFANQNAPSHLATYHVLAQVLIRLGRTAEARQVLETGIQKVAGVGEGMGRDLGPALREMRDRL